MGGIRTMINYEEFLAKYYSTANTAKQEDIKRFLEHLTEIASGKTAKDVLADKKLLCKAFFLHSTGNVSRPHYQKIKEYLLNLFDFYGIDGDIPTREEVISSQSTVTYFRSIEKLLSFIDSVGHSKSYEYNPTRDLTRVKGVCILGWLGFTPKEISDFVKTDLRTCGIDKFIVSRNGNEYEISGEPFAALYFLSGLEEYKSNGKTIILKGDDSYLIRSTSSTCNKLDEGQIIQIIKRFNAQIPPHMNTAILFRNLHKNALFLEVYADKSDKSLIDKITSVMGCTPNYALNYKQQYLDFVNLMESGKI